MDLPEAYENWESFKEKLQSRGITPFCMSAVKREGTHEVICAAYELLRKSNKTRWNMKVIICFKLILCIIVTSPEYSFFSIKVIAFG